MDLFAHYDQDNSGTINKGELICLLSDIGVLDGLKPEETSAVLDQAYANADGNGDGGISYNEFRSFMDKFSHLKPKPSLPQNIPDSFRKNGKDEIVWQIYLQHCSKKYPQEMGSAQFIRAAQGGLRGREDQPEHHRDPVRQGAQAHGEAHTIPEFLRALAYMASGELTFEVAAARFANRAILRPITNVTVPKSTMNVTAPMETAPMPLAAARDVPAAVEEDPPPKWRRSRRLKSPRRRLSPSLRAARRTTLSRTTRRSRGRQSPSPMPVTTVSRIPTAKETTRPHLHDVGRPLVREGAGHQVCVDGEGGGNRDMKSWELKDAIDAVGQMPVPKSMIEASGNKMLIREFFYQCCSNGKKELMPDEVALLTSLELFKGLEDEEVSDIVRTTSARWTPTATAS